MLQEPAERIAILDFGGQYTHLIARRVRALGVFSEILHPQEFKPDAQEGLVGVILSGGPDSVLTSEMSDVPFDFAQIQVPILGLCFGHQLLAMKLGGEVEAGAQREYGLTPVNVATDSTLFEGLPERQNVWMSHGDHVTRLPDGFYSTAQTDTVPVAAYESADHRIFGFQFHPEVTHTKYGNRMLERFVRRCSPNQLWDAGNIVDQLVHNVQEKVKDKRIFLLISGGVDSLVTLAVCLKAVGPERVVSLHIDTGFMRLGESAEVMAFLKRLGFANLHIADASKSFFDALENVVEPETKRKIIGRLFVEEVGPAIQRLGLGDDWLLAQGTIYPDTIESGGTKNSSTIKTHHNRVAEIEEMIKEGRIIEPISELYKDEVREVGAKLGLPADLVNRHPFPGPGLAIRVIATDRNFPETDFDKEGKELQELALQAGLRGEVLPVKSVGVQGDFRTYHHPAVLWSEKGEPTWETLLESSARIVNRLNTVNRVVFSPGGFERTGLRMMPTFATPQVVERLQRVDSLVRRLTAHHEEIWQIPVVSLPLFDWNGKQVFVARPVCSRDAMTASPFEMDFEEMRELAAAVASLSGAGLLLYDVSTKPPATIEWE